MPPALQQILDDVVARGAAPGAVALIADGDEVEVAVAGVRTPGGPAMTRDSLFRIASMGKPITAAAAMALVDRGVLRLDDRVARWFPELGAAGVLRRPDGPLDDVEPITRPITLHHLLAFQHGLGLPADPSWPIGRRLLDDLHQGPPDPAVFPAPDAWMRLVAATPLVHQPGEGWTYGTGSDLLGVLLARATGQDLEAVLRDTVLDPLGMADTGFAPPAGAADRMTGFLVRGERTGDLQLADPPDGAWSTPPAFPSGAGGLLSTADDWLAFGRMLLAQGQHEGRQVLTREAVAQMMTAQATAEPGNIFLGGHAWGFGGSVDLAAREPWEVPGRYGWVGGTGTAGYVLPDRGRVVVHLSQVQLAGPGDFAAMADVLAVAAG